MPYLYNVTASAEAAKSFNVTDLLIHLTVIYCGLFYITYDVSF